MTDVVVSPPTKTEPHEKTGTTAQWLAFLTPIVTPIITTVLTVVMMYATFIQTRSNRKIDEIHTFTNSALGAALRAEAISARTLASYTKLPKDIETAEKAEIAAAAHDASQKAVDTKEAK